MNFRYQCSYFADLVALRPTPDLTLDILRELTNRKLGLLPSTIQEFTPPHLSGESRLQFVNNDLGIEINILRSRLDVIQQFRGVTGAGLGPIQDFSQMASQCIDSVLGTRPVAGHRLSLVIQELAPATGEDELHRQFDRLFNPPSFYKSHPPNEWTYRSNARSTIAFDNFDEPVNVISKAERVQGEMFTPAGTTSFDRVLREFDINTVPERTATRFGHASMTAFVVAASDIYTTVSSDMSKRLDG